MCRGRRLPPTHMDANAGEPITWASATPRPSRSALTLTAPDPFPACAPPRRVVDWISGIQWGTSVLVSRRSFMAGLGAATAVPAAVLPGAMRPSAGSRYPDLPGYFFFDAAEARFIEAACERLIPADASGPGALD